LHLQLPELVGRAGFPAITRGSISRFVGFELWRKR